MITARSKVGRVISFYPQAVILETDRGKHFVHSNGQTFSLTDEEFNNVLRQMGDSSSQLDRARKEHFSEVH